MSLSPCRTPRALALVAWALMLLVATSAATPRLRAASRERGGRASVLRTGSPRANDRQGWVAPDPTAGGAQTHAGGGDGQGDDDRSPAVPALVAWPVDVHPVARPAAGERIDREDPGHVTTRWRTRACAGRAPPTC
jgi:hypothetical protein